MSRNAHTWFLAGMFFCLSYRLDRLDQCADSWPDLGLGMGSYRAVCRCGNLRHGVLGMATALEAISASGSVLFSRDALFLGRPIRVGALTRLSMASLLIQNGT